MPDNESQVSDNRCNQDLTRLICEFQDCFRVADNPGTIPFDGHKGVCRYQSGETVNFPQAIFWPGTTSGLPVIGEVSKGCSTCNDGFRHAFFGTNNARASSETSCGTTGSRAPMFLIAIAVHFMRRRSGLVSSRQLCALTPRMRTEV